MPSFDLLTIGAATQDVFLKSAHFEEIKDTYAPDGMDACFPLGSKIRVDDVTFATGGGATNAAITFARFKLKTACLARIGRDEAGQSILTQLQKEKIWTHAFQIDEKQKTAYSVILLSGTGHRSILTYRGASGAIQAVKIPWKTLRTKWLYITSLNGDLELLRRLFVFAEKTNARIAWNPGNAELTHGMKKLEPFLVRTSILLLNREEAAVLAELPPRHLEQILGHLGIYPQSALVVTDGQKGAYVRSEGKTLFAPALKAKRVNTTGAGDAFGSAFVASFIKSKDAKLALQAGTLNATSVICHMGAKAGILKKAPSAWELRKVKTVVIS
ncbi:MAG TPA: carbohydrate kinase family protein [Patescibacteria group bacterium]|nr:carbohydrate kinase family protein [Patescibacteria group bacterium]